MKGPKLLLASVGHGLVCATGFGAIIGTNPPAQPITFARIAELPKTQQPAWKAYLENSGRQLQADQSFFAKEMQRNKIATIHDDVNEISKERRNGYAWYRDTPNKALQRYAERRKKFSQSH